MSMGSRALLGRVIIVSALLALVAVARPEAVGAAVGNPLRTITPNGVAPTVDGTVVNPTCGNQGGTSVAIVQGSKLALVNAVTNPVLLAITCLDNSDVTKRSTVNF